MRGSRRVLARLAERRDRRIGSLRIQRVELLSADQWHALLAGSVRLVRAGVLVAFAGAWIEAVLNALPWTRPHARITLVWLQAPLAYLWHGVLAVVPDLFFLAIITLAATGLLRLIRLVFDGIKRGAIREPRLRPGMGRFDLQPDPGAGRGARDRRGLPVHPGVGIAGVPGHRPAAGRAGVVLVDRHRHQCRGGHDPDLHRRLQGGRPGEDRRRARRRRAQVAPGHARADGQERGRRDSERRRAGRGHRQLHEAGRGARHASCTPR